MKTRILALTRLAIYVGPTCFAIGVVIAASGEFTAQSTIVFIGLCLAAAGLIVWGCHGIRRRGKRPGFVAMTGLGGVYLLLHLNYRFSDYRWAQINNMGPGSTSATLAHLEERITLLLCVLIVSTVLGLLFPLPETSSSRLNR